MNYFLISQSETGHRKIETINRYANNRNIIKQRTQTTKNKPMLF